jgi:Pregnancy-associated plasma protein-A/Secretion system C-terminal sorting domain
MKKKNLAAIAVFVLFLCGLKSYAQNGGCQTVSPEQLSSSEDKFNRYVTWFKATGRHLNTDLKVIPVIIHVIYRNPADRLQITMPRVLGQIDATNKQLRRLNANAVDTRPAFLPVATDCNIQVALATRKPDGSRFNGVLYHSYPNFNISDYNAVVKATIIDPDRYMNVWVLPDLSNGVAVFPWDKTPVADGFYIGSRIFGITGSNLSPVLNKGAIFTHELAHCLGVLHTFDNGYQYTAECKRLHDGSISDFCGDTPLDWGLYGEYPPVCDNGVRTDCGDDEYILQTENFMFYNHDRCTNMFSKDQRARMRACLSRLRPKLTSPGNMLYTGVRVTDYRPQPECKPILERDITLYPNPASSSIHFKFADQPLRNMSVKVYNLMGVKLKDVNSAAAITELNVNALSAGTYYVAITIDNSTVTKYFIKGGADKSLFIK